MGPFDELGVGKFANRLEEERLSLELSELFTESSSLGDSCSVVI